MDGPSNQPLYDAVASSYDGSVPQLDLTAEGQSIDAASGSTLFGMSFQTVAIGAVALVLLVVLLGRR
jgi:hypothetical protein